MSSEARSPFKGLSAFEDSEADALLFFGREREREIVVANLIASRLTVLYGPSGVGKSSLLRAAVARSLRELPEQPLVVVFSRWSEDPAAALAEAVAEAVGGGNGSALEALERAQADREVYLVLDQAEEYFLYHADDGGPGSFAETLPALLAAPQRVNVLVSLREDSLAKLDRFTGRIPGLFGNTLRLDRLVREAARAAIEKPVARFAELTGEAMTVEPALVERVLDEVGAGQIEPALGGLGAVEGADDSMRIEAPYLQLVMQRIWEEERAGGSDRLRLQTLERLGGAQHVVEEHLEGAIGELAGEDKDVAARLFNHLVTPSGTKIAHEVSDLADFGGVSVENVQPVLESLARRRILRSLHEGGGVRYEIFHDVLAQPVLAWRASHESERELQLQRKESDRRHRRLLAVIVAGAFLLAAMGAVTVFALTQRSEARLQARQSKASELRAVAGAQLGRDPELSLALALEAARLEPGESSERALRDSLAHSRVRAVSTFGEAVMGAAPAGDDVIAVTVSGEVVRADSTAGVWVDSVSLGVPAAGASFARDGTALVTGRDGAIRVVRGDRSTAIPGVDDARGASLSPDGTLAAVVRPGGVRLVDVESGAVRQTYEHAGAISAAVSHDNRRVATGGVDDRVLVWSGQSGRRVHSLAEHAGNAVALEFSPDGAWIATASSDGVARIFRTSGWGLASSVAGHTHALNDVSFSADGEHVVTSGADGTALVSHTETGDQLVVLAGSADEVTAGAFTGGAGSPVVTASRDGTVREWDAVFQPKLELLARVRGPVDRLDLGDDGLVRAVTDDGRVHIVDPESGSEVAAEPANPRGRRVTGPEGVAATMRGRSVLLSTDEGRTVLSHRDRVTGIAFSGDGTRLVTSSLDKVARIWRVPDGLELEALRHNTAVHDARFSPDGKWIVTAANRAGIWDARDASNLLRLQGHEGTLTSAVFGADGTTVYTGGVDGTLRQFECELCGGLDELVALAEKRLAATGRELRDEERERYLD